MKRLAVLVNSLFIFLGLLVSCQNDIKIGKKAYLTFGDVSRVIQPTELVFNTDEEISFELKGRQEESEFTTLRTWSYDEEKGTAYNQMIQSNILIELGEWDFELLAIKNDQPFLKGSVVDKNIVIGENILNFGTMEILKEDGLTGSINFKLEFPFDEIKVVKCGLYDLNSNVEIENFESKSLNISSLEEGSRFVCYEKTDVPVGIYFMKFEFYSDEDATNRIKVYSPVINVVAGHLTEGEYVLESINTFYTIKYELNGASWRDVYNKPETYFNKNALVYLPTSEDLIYEGYNFIGWYIGDKKIESPYRYSDLENTSSVITLTAHWEENLSVIYSYELGRQNYASEGGASLVPSAYNSEGVVTEYKANVVYPTNSQTVWDYYVKPEDVSFTTGVNYAVSVKLKSKNDTVVGIQAANADMFFTVNGEQEEWTTCTFETGFIEKALSDEKNGITIGFALAEEIYISSLKISPIQGDDNLPTLAFNVTKTGINKYLANEKKAENIIEVAKTSSNDGYNITINTHLAHEDGQTSLVEDVTLEIRDYVSSNGLNKACFNMSVSDSDLQTALEAKTDSSNMYSTRWNSSTTVNSNESEAYTVFFPSYKTESTEEFFLDGLLKGGNDSSTTINLSKFKISSATTQDVLNGGKVFIIKGGNNFYRCDGKTKDFVLKPNQSLYCDVLLAVPKDSSGKSILEENGDFFEDPNYNQFGWIDCIRFVPDNVSSTDSFTINIGNGEDGKPSYFVLTNKKDEEITLKISLDDECKVQIEEVTTGGTTSGGEATSESPSDLNRGLSYFSKTENNSNISCLYIYDDVGLGLYRDLVNGTLAKDLTFTKNGYPIGSIPTSYTGRVDAYLANDIIITDAWTPIGTSSNSFTSSFDGQGHSITINSVADGEYAGVFGYAGNYAEPNSIVNLAVKGVLSSANAKYVGGIVACSNGIKVENCINMASLGSGTYVGGIIGYVNEYTKNEVSKCINVGEIILASSTSHYRGGIVAHTAGNITISDCINLVELSSNGTGKGSGIVDVENTKYNPNTTVNNCINVGFVNFDVKIAIANKTNTTTIENCYYDSDKWTRVVFDETNTYTPTDTSSIAKSTSELCKLTTDELSGKWSCVTEETRYPLPDLSSVFTDNTIWQEICDAAKTVTEISSWADLVDATSELIDQPTVTFLITEDLTANQEIELLNPIRIKTKKI